MLSVPALAYAQGSTNAPPGGVSSTTAPSNSQGTPAGGTGIISTSRTPGTTPAGAAPLVGGELGTRETTHTSRRRRRHRRVRHPAASAQ